MKIKKIDLDPEMSSSMPDEGATADMPVVDESEYAPLAPKLENEQWRKYSEVLAKRCYFAGTLSPECGCIYPYKDIFSIYSRPIKYFGNLNFAAEWYDGYRVYNDASTRTPYAGHIRLVFDSQNYLVAVLAFIDGLDLMICSERCTHDLVEMQSDIQKTWHFSKFSDYLLKKFKYINLYEPEDAPCLAPPKRDDRYITEIFEQRSVLGLPKYTGRSGEVYDVMRGYGYESLGDIARMCSAGDNFPAEELLNEFKYSPFSCSFLRVSTKIAENVHPLLKVARYVYEDENFSYFVLIDCEGSATAVLNILAFLNDVPKVVDKDSPIIPMYDELRRLGVKVSREGYYEFNIIA